MKVIRVKPNELAEIVEIEPNLKSYQNEVGGYIEAAYPWFEEIALICNEEGKFNGSSPNRALYMDGEIYDIVFGTFLVVGCGEENFRSLTDEEAERYKKRFLCPETFFRTADGKIISFKTTSY